jgi:CheY-like chemotaxis protein
VRPACDAHQQQVTLKLPAEPVHLHADATRLEQVFGNLLGNASKYSGEGSHIVLSVEMVPCDGSSDTREVAISVKDDGAGIDPELLPRIFDLFVQATRALDRAHGGLGIGLTLAQRLVRLHGGSLEARSEGLGRGAEFIVRLPVLAGTPAPGVPPPRPATADRPLRILVVDDNADSARSMALLQSRRGHETRAAFTGPEALAAAAEFLPEVVLLDLGLPGMDGYEVARQIRAQPALGQTRIFAMTGYGTPEDRAQSKAGGFDEHLVKPIDLEILRALLQSPAAAQ